MAYIISSGKTSSGGTLENNSMTVLNGGTVNDLTLDSGGYLDVSSGGTASKTTANYWGDLIVESGGTAIDTIINSFGYVGVASKGTATRTVINSGGSLRVVIDGIANSTTINSGGSYENLGSANNTTINSGGRMIVSMGIANSTTINSGGCIYVYSGGTATNLTVSRGGQMALTIAPDTYISGTSDGSAFEYKDGLLSDATVTSVTFSCALGGVVSNATISSQGTLNLFYRGSATNTTVESGGMLLIYSSSTVNQVTVNGGLTVIYGKASANDITVTGGSFIVSSGATATNIGWTPFMGDITIKDGAVVTYSNKIQGVFLGQGSRLISSSIEMDSFVLRNYESMYVMDKGVANDITLTIAQMHVMPGGVAGNPVISSGGTLYVSSGGTATGVDWTPCEGKVYVQEGGSATFISQYSGVYYGSNSHLLSHAVTISSMTVGSGAIMYIMSGGTAVGNTVSGSCNVIVSSCGTAENTLVKASGLITVYSGGIANRTSIGSRGNLYVSAGGTATNTTVDNAVADFILLSGGSADHTTVNRGRLIVSGTANDIKLNPDGSTDTEGWTGVAYFDVGYGGVASNIDVGRCSFLEIYSGGTAYNTYVHNSDNGCNYGVEVLPGGTASKTSVGSGGSMRVRSGGVAEDAIISGSFIVEGTLNSAAIEYGWTDIYTGGVANDITISRTNCLCQAGTVNRAVVNQGGSLTVRGLLGNSSATGQINHITVNSGGVIRVSYSGWARNITVNSKGSLIVNSDGTITGQITFTDGAIVSAYEGSILDFDISELDPDATVRVNNLSRIKGALRYTLTVSDTQANGVYSLAYGAGSFNSTITVMNTSGSELGVLTVGETATINGNSYTLNRNSGKLTLSVNVETDETNDPVEPIVINSGDDFLLAHAMPEAEYMYGCTPTAIGMLLGYYDLYGYEDRGFSNLIEGDVDLKSRGTDGNPYDMDAFDTVLGRAIASEEYVFRFHSRNGKETTPDQELEYAFKEDGKTLDTGIWNCIADYLGTGQYWRGNDNFSTTTTFSSLKNLYRNDSDITIDSDSASRTIRYIEHSMLYGLDLYVQSRGYSLDDSRTGTYDVDVNGGSFSFAHYISEIDAGRPVMISIDDHSMVGYGYNAETMEIIFDDCYESGQRMVWDGTYLFSGEERKLQSITVIVLDEASGDPGPKKPIVSADITEPTNQDVLVSATFGKTSTVREYSKDGETWYNYTGPVKFEENGTVYFRGKDEEGVLSKIAAYTVSNIDKTAPDKPVVSAVVTTPTNGDVLVSATFSEDSVVREYSLDNGKTWNQYIGSVWFEENGTICFRAADAVGNVSDVTLYTVSNIDKTAPDKPVASADITAPTNANVLVSATFSEDSVVREYSLDNGKTWTAYTEAITFTENGTVCFRAKDAVGNQSEITRLEVTNIENCIVLRPSASADVVDPTNGNVLVSAVFSENSVVKEYSLDGTNWQAYTTAILFTANGTAYFRGTDAEGNQSDITRYYVTNIDRTPPAKPSPCANITTPTNGDVLVSAAFSQDSTVRQYSLDNTNWSTYSSSIRVSENGSIFFRGMDAAGNVSETAECKVTNIDRTPPAKPTASASVTTATSNDVSVMAKFSKDSVTKEYSLDGKTWLAYTSAVLFVENGTVFFRGTDKAGNRSEITRFDVTNIDKSMLDDGRNNFLYDKKKEPKRNPDSNFSSYALQDGVSAIMLDEEGSVSDETMHNFVGIGDEADFAKITLENAAKLVFSLSATDAVTFTVWHLAEGKDKNGGTTYSQKSLQSTPLKKAKDGTDYAAQTKPLLLDAGEYYISAQSANKKNGYAFYNVELSPDSEFFINGDKSDDWTDLKDSGENSSEYSIIGTLNEGSGCILDGWVGFGDSVDYAKFSLDSSAKLSFKLNATNATKFTVYTLSKDKMGIWSLKSLQTTTLTKNKTTDDYAATTKALVMEAGDYYIAMQSTNAAKGGSAYYGAFVNEAAAVFFVDHDDGANDWVYDKKGDPMFNSDENFVTTEITAGTKEVLLDKDGVSIAGWSNFVGYEDPVDYAKITLSADAELSFSILALDASKFAVYSLTEKKGKYTLKALQTTTLKKAKGATEYKATTKALSLASGEYYISMKSTNAKKGGAAYYNVSLNTADCSGLPDGGIVQETIMDAQVASSLAMSETDSLASTDALSFGGYDADLLASASALTNLDDKSAWRNIGQLA